MIALSFQLKHPAYRARRAALKALVARACKAALAHEGVMAGEVCAVLADDAAIQALNRDFRGKDRPTNVLSFEGDGREGGGHLGDVIVSLDTVAREAAQQNKTLDAHIAHLVVHATLHLLGYDHEQASEAARMEAQEIKILEKLGVDNPYL